MARHWLVVPTHPPSRLLHCYPNMLACFPQQCFTCLITPNPPFQCKRKLLITVALQSRMGFVTTVLSAPEVMKLTAMTTHWTLMEATLLPTCFMRWKTSLMMMTQILLIAGDLGSKSYTAHLMGSGGKCCS